MGDFKWNETSELAAQLIAQGTLAISDVADRIGVTRQTLWIWRKSPEFVARVDENLAEIRSDIRRVGLADVERRVAALNDRWTRLRRVIEARADDPTMKDVPGGTTGLLIRTTKGLGSGEAFTLVEEYAVDTGLLRELREHEKQAAQELGQWTERKQIDDARKAYDVTNAPDDL